MATPRQIQPHGLVSLYGLASTTSPGDIVQAPDGRAAIVQGLNLPANADGTIDAVGATHGEFEIASGSATTFGAGDTVEVDSSSQLAVADTAGDFDIGSAVIAKTSGQTVVRVALNE